MAAPARQLSATPSFAGVAVCAAPGCGTILSRYSDDPDGFCAPCRRRVNDEPERSASGIDLERLIAGLLLTHDALHSGEPVNVIVELASMGIEVDCWQVRGAVRHAASRHGLIARGVRGRPGYTLVEWERRYKPVLGFGGVEMDRDPDSGQYAAAVALGVAAVPEADRGTNSQPSLPGLSGDCTDR